ncbi:MAG: hypothetical protein VYE64_04335 [Planctomycetota bacterium]|nr:hypothetical protein [Planctomycetota bacterium]
MHLGQKNLGQWMLCGWPGLAPLWLRGSWSSLALAVGFSVLLNIALVATFAWPTLLGDSFPAVAWPLIFVIWVCSSVVSCRMVGSWVDPPVMAAEAKVVEKGDFFQEKQPDTLFNRAQGEYLKGNWSEVERLLKGRLKQKDRDVESRLLLATLYRHTGRPELARVELDSLKRFDESVHWDFEISNEYERIIQLEQESRNETVTTDLATDRDASLSS